MDKRSAGGLVCKTAVCSQHQVTVQAIHWWVGLNDPCGSLPTRNILWFCENYIKEDALILHLQNSWLSANIIQI